LPEQGRSLGALVCGRAISRRHGAATSSARAWRLGYLILSAGCGYLPAPVATAGGAAEPARPAVATAQACTARAQACTARARARTARARVRTVKAAAGARRSPQLPR
jgi:hypothetical protein